MAAEKIIYSLLSNGTTSAITTEISPRQQDITRDNRNPYVVYYRNQTMPNHTKTTTSVIDEEVYIVECYAMTHHEAAALADAVRSDLDRAPATTYSGVVLNGSSFRNQTDGDYDDKTQLFMIECEFAFRISRAGTI